MSDQSADQRSRLVRAAWTVVRRSGFDGIKVQLVLKESGLSARTFYRHFADKDSLLVALIEDEYGAVSRRLRRALTDADPDPAAQVSAWIREMLLAASSPDRAPRARLFSSYHALMAGAPGALLRSNQMIIEPLEAAVRKGEAAGVFVGDDPHSDAQQVARLTAGALNEYLATEDSSIEQLIDAVVRFALRALTGSPQPAS
ncbi:MAG TPA: TetR/AcrR family transcriptional regulator [Acidimicrobiales bacterium]|nr:TetR/AcrR family transcriptional regulator [Acidimicrobiales bacterium]